MPSGLFTDFIPRDEERIVFGYLAGVNLRTLLPLIRLAQKQQSFGWQVIQQTAKALSGVNHLRNCCPFGPKRRICGVWPAVGVLSLQSVLSFFQESQFPRRW